MSLPDALLFSSATGLLALLRARAISATELVDAHLARIAAVNPRLNAVVSMHRVFLTCSPPTAAPVFG